MSKSSVPTTGTLPPLSALFAVVFDVKAGYTIVWSQTIRGLSLNDVEYKSLPSGLHKRSSDLVYFTHSEHTGLSYFLNSPREDAARGAIMLAIGILVPSEHPATDSTHVRAHDLQRLAEKFAENIKDFSILEEYWNTANIYGSEEGDTDSAKSNEYFSEFDSASKLRFRHSPSKRSVMSLRKQHLRSRSAGDFNPTIRHRPVQPREPLRNLIELVEALGPLIFPIYRSALARKRILIYSEPPVETACNHVSSLVQLARIPPAVSDLIAPSRQNSIKALYIVGVHDIPQLEEEARFLKQTEDGSRYSPRNDSGQWRTQGWVACTTDALLRTKSSLYDILITFPPAYSKDAKTRPYALVERSDSTRVLASQRDLRRYRALKRALYEATSNTSLPPRLTTSNEKSQCVKPTWPEYLHGFVEKASQRLFNESFFDKPVDTVRIEEPSVDDLDTYGETLHPSLEIYFHHLTTQLITTMADIIDSEADEDYFSPEGDMGESTRLTTNIPGGTDGMVKFSADDVSRMGLDEWNDNDRETLKELVRGWFGKRAEVQKPKIGIEFCGIISC